MGVSSSTSSLSFCTLLTFCRFSNSFSSMSNDFTSFRSCAFAFLEAIALTLASLSFSLWASVMGGLGFLGLPFFVNLIFGSLGMLKISLTFIPSLLDLAFGTSSSTTIVTLSSSISSCVLSLLSSNSSYTKLGLSSPVSISISSSLSLGMKSIFTSGIKLISFIYNIYFNSL